ncbi:hypothetical protein RND71_039250 [Anisodus tanguticus]|uniref:Uncharacterized protein n=1 Tax=Anisodus tanguticus TaxID=243964 RepID=A0AAE1UXF6_9SOLA|nr:hypothetical protein RND71_039250 [Anisodus tanguticus]
MILFQFLDVLSLHCFDGLASFQVGEFCLPKLKKVKLDICLRQLQIVDVAAINLEDLYIYSPWNLKLKASDLLEAKIYFDSLANPDTDWYSKLPNFLVNFNHSVAIDLSSKNDEVMVIPKDVRVNFLPPLHATNNLHVNIEKRLKYSIVDVVYSLLWISPQLDTISFGGTLRLKDPKDASNEAGKPCCSSTLGLLEA